MDRKQCPGYGILNGELFDRKTYATVDTDEPVFVLRGKDAFAAKALIEYGSLVKDPAYKEEVTLALAEFIKYERANKSKMKDGA